MSNALVLAAGIAGLPIGSVLNRLIVREPGYLIVDPGDLPEGADPALLNELQPVPVVDAVPMLSLLRPRRAWRGWFPITEVVTAGVFALTVHRIGDQSPTLAVLFLMAALITLAAIDLRVFRIPDRINFPAMAIGFALIVVTSVEQGAARAIAGAVAGAVTYFGFLFLAHVISPRGMGFGDVKLAGLMGLYLGWLGWVPGSAADQYLGALRFVLLGAGLGSVAGVVTGLAYAVVRRSAKAVFPYGPSLAFGCAVVVLWSSALR